ncbi:MAG: hypothetical protein IKT68_08275, partial [Clostridia bacterium]|nr:hypothetical protein [Clostridia bacterium]
AAVVAAREAYNALTSAQKAYVTNLEKLQQAESKIAELKAQADQEALDKAAAKLVADQIDALNVQSLNDESAVVAAREAYNALTSAQKAYVTNLEKLVAAETKIADLKAEKEAQEAADKAAAQAVTDAIAALNVDSLDDEADVVAAREAYDALTDTQKDLVTNLAVLKAAEQTILQLKADYEAQIEADKMLAQIVTDQIDALNVQSLSNEPAVVAARAAYERLTDAQKGYVTNLDKLEQAEATIADLTAQTEKEAADKAAAKVVADQIDALNVQSLDDEPDVVATREAYNALTADQKAYVTNLGKLETAEQAIADLKNVVPPVEILYGDVDGDGNVSAADALEVLKAVVGKSTLTDDQTKAADTDGNGKIEAGDALNILKKVVNKIDKFPVEK